MSTIKSKRIFVKFRKLGALLELMRWPNLLVLAAAQILTAVFLAGVIHSSTADIDLGFLALIMSTVFIAAAGYIINDYYDVKIDYINKPDRVIIGKHLRRRQALFLHSFLNISGVAMSFYAGWKIALVAFFCSFILWVYSNLLKRLPFWGNFTVALLAGVSIALVGIYYETNQHLVNTYALFAFCITLVREIIKDLEDLRGDESFGCKTLPIIWGVYRTKIFVYVLSALFIFVMFYMAGTHQNKMLIYYFSLLIVPITYLIYRLVYADTKKHFAHLSSFCKWLILAGIFSMLFFGF
ncbi:MAG: geranylgeranylglycerol-phosphate geranylgeranyltransferase [Cyclobacteriaceae bacterium]|nr:geranylgeranylglycerol-phosphate geranylgeranyltransferase [Cyclobacteriaceae bacterium]MCH8516841.1 geranylgeranylglycerol-phosphate geranylgeranyltransferase [Cyclobacteriaceae bacterium]